MVHLIQSTVVGFRLGFGEKTRKHSFRKTSRERHKSPQSKLKNEQSKVVIYMQNDTIVKIFM